MKYLLLLIAVLLCSACSSTHSYVRVKSDFFDPTPLVEVLRQKSCFKGATSGSTELHAAEERGTGYASYSASAETTCER